jgi:mRNA interferase MazF
MSMPSYLKGSIVLVRFPFSDLSAAKVRPAVVVNAPSRNVFVVPLTSKLDRLQAGEFIMQEWKAAGLNVQTAVKRGLFTIHESLILKRVGSIAPADTEPLEQSLRAWLQL